MNWYDPFLGAPQSKYVNKDSKEYKQFGEAYEQQKKEYYQKQKTYEENQTARRISQENGQPMPDSIDPPNDTYELWFADKLIDAWIVSVYAGYGKKENDKLTKDESYDVICQYMVTFGRGEDIKEMDFDKIYKKIDKNDDNEVSQIELKALMAVYRDAFFSSLDKNETFQGGKQGFGVGAAITFVLMGGLPCSTF